MKADKNELKKYLVNNPWPEEYYGKKQFDFCNTYTLEIPPDKLWSIIINPSPMIRFPDIRITGFKEKDGKISGAGQLFQIRHEWIENQWEWETNREISFSRVFTKGIISYIRTHYIISGTDDNFSKLTFYIGWIPRNFASGIIFKISQNYFEKKFRKKLIELQSEHINNTSPGRSETFNNCDIPHLSGIYKSHEKKIEAIRDHLETDGFETSLVYQLFNFIINSPDDRLYRIRPKELSEASGIEPGKIISLMLHSCRCGLINLSWDIVCPHCRVTREKHSHLGTIADKAACEQCGISFSPCDINIIEATFSVDPEIKRLTDVNSCDAEPVNRPHIIMQKTLARGANFTFQIPDIEKRLRFRIKGKKSCGILDISSKAPKKDLYWDDLNSIKIFKCSPGSTVYINNTGKEPEHYIIESGEEDQYALRPHELFNINEFHELFPGETPAEEMSFDIGIQNILFAGITGQEELYKNYGERDAFKIIREYHLKFNQIIKQYGGVPINTTLNSIMLSFANPLDALRCSIKLIQTFDGSDKSVPVTIRISINRGSCLAVNNVSLVDYFSYAVNIASDLLEFSEAGEICLTANFINEDSVSRYLKQKNYTIKNWSSIKIKGADQVRFKKIRIKKLP